MNKKYLKRIIIAAVISGFIAGFKIFHLDQYFTLSYM